METSTYGRRELAQAYLAAQGDERFGGYRVESSAYNQALEAHHRARLAGLEQLFGIQLTHEGMPSLDARAMFMLFRSTAQSFLAITTPGSRFLEAGLLHRALDRAGRTGRTSPTSATRSPNWPSSLGGPTWTCSTPSSRSCSATAPT